MKIMRSTGLTLVTLSLLLEVPAIAQTASVQSIDGTGKVRVQREKRSDWLPVRQGTTLYQGDQILPDRGVKVYVRCPDSNKTLVRAGVPSGLGSICLRWSYRDFRGTQAEETLGGIDPSIPYLITPRHSLLLSSTPLIRWNPVSGATEYRVEVTGPSGSMWSTQTKDTQIVYAGKSLEAGVPYSITVQTNTGKSSRDDRAPNQTQPSSNLDFRILRPAEAAAIKAEAAKISSTPPTTAADALDLARLYGNYVLPESVIKAYNLSPDNYQTYSLTGDAIALLEASIKQGKGSPILHRTLGDLYWQTGLIRPAQIHYLKAIDLVQGLEDLEDWTLAHHSLGKTYAAIGNAQQTLQHYRQAKAGYTFLRDTGAATDLARRIQRLEAATTGSQSIAN
ncbi:MAG: hypothetical protein NW220_17450 [Leptolyngbyaceae cyanobacterium bins.349]|nr:hypothetical protein [Leptolyngbyaceae cyanobacterium bins.349]